MGKVMRLAQPKWPHLGSTYAGGSLVRRRFCRVQDILSCIDNYRKVMSEASRDDCNQQILDKETVQNEI